MFRPHRGALARDPPWARSDPPVPTLSRRGAVLPPARGDDAHLLRRGAHVPPSARVAVWEMRSVRQDTDILPSMKLHLVPMSLAQANEHVAFWHRHNRPVPGAKFCIGAADDEGVLRAVAIVGRPVARMFDDGQTLEVNRVATDGTRNANSMLYGACARAGFALGYTKIITYTRTDESGSSLKAAGWKVIAERPATVGWSRPSRSRDNGIYDSVPRQLWEAISG